MKLKGNYYVSVRAAGAGVEESTDFCPFYLDSEEKHAEQQDGMYGLYDEVMEAVFPGLKRELSDKEEEKFQKAYRAYITPLHKALRQGKTSGELMGVVGRRLWVVGRDTSDRRTPFFFEPVEGAPKRSACSVVLGCGFKAPSAGYTRDDSRGSEYGQWVVVVNEGADEGVHFQVTHTGSAEFTMHFYSVSDFQTWSKSV